MTVSASALRCAMPGTDMLYVAIPAYAERAEAEDARAGQLRCIRPSVPLIRPPHTSPSVDGSYVPSLRWRAVIPL
eukprot:3190672-Rhodomonas_salina.2